jgi:hypothetical protein
MKTFSARKHALIRLRAAVAGLAVAVLLVCPYVCIGQTGAARAGKEHTRQSWCNCCGPNQPAPDQPEGNQPGRDRPSDSGSGTQGGDCLCHGAVLQSPPTLPSFDHGPAAFLPVDDLPATAESSIFGDSLFAVEHTACQFASADSGRKVRALIESLLL